MSSLWNGKRGRAGTWTVVLGALWLVACARSARTYSGETHTKGQNGWTR